MSLNRRSFIAGTLSLPLVGVAPLLAADATPLPPEPVRRAIADARAYAKSEAAQIWPGYAAAPFQLLLVGEEREHLFFSSGPARGFGEAIPDPITGSEVKARKRRFATNRLATFPAVDWIPTIVVGHPEGTPRPNEADWTIMLLHEHFHQLQYSTPDYQQRIETLDLSSGDRTGRWMLDFPFPYHEEDLSKLTEQAAAALARAVVGSEGPKAHTALSEYLDARSRLRDRAGDRNWRYFAFQCYQEGVARHAEIRLSANAPHPDWQAASTRLRRQTLAVLRDFDLAGDKRIGLYAYGAGEALLLDRWLPGWEQRYLGEPLSLDRLFTSLHL